MNKNKNKICQNLWDTAKEVLRGTFIVLTTYIKKRKNISNQQSNLQTCKRKIVNISGYK